jgi:hypothetical protein
MPLPSEPSFSDSLKEHQRREFYERHKSIAVVMIFVVFLLPFVGLFITGLFGALLGAVVSVMAYYLTPYAVLKLRGE